MRQVVTCRFRCTRNAGSDPGECWRAVPDFASIELSGEPIGRVEVELADVVVIVPDELTGFLHRLVATAVHRVDGTAVASVRVGRDAIGVVHASTQVPTTAVVERGITDAAGGTAPNGGAFVIDDENVDDGLDQRFGPHTVDLAAVISLPLPGLDRATGVLTLHARSSHVFGPAQLAQARRYADEAARALALALRLARQDEVTDQLRSALASRSAIDRAIGIIMGQNGCDAAAAFAILRAASQHRNVKLRMVATEIVSTMTRPPDAAPHRTELGPGT